MKSVAVAVAADRRLQPPQSTTAEQVARPRPVVAAPVALPPPPG